MKSRFTQPVSLFRLADIIAPRGPLPISRSTWLEGVKSGRYPAPIKLGPGITCWREHDIKQLIETGKWSPAIGDKSDNS